MLNPNSPLRLPTLSFPSVSQITSFCRRNARPLLLILISAAATTFYMVGKPYIMYDDSDPLSYIRKAWFLIGRQGGIDQPFRGPGYPLFMIVTGLAVFDTWWIFIVCQLLMATFMPVLIYACLSPVTRTGGFVAGLLFIWFGVAYYHMNWVMSEELFLFVQFLLFALVARYCAGHTSIGGLYTIALLSAYAVMIRPTAAFYFWIFVAISLVFFRARWRAFVGPIATFVAIMTAWGVYDYYTGAGRFPQNFAPQTNSQRYFAEVYYGENYHLTSEIKPAISPEDGPESSKLYDAVLARIAANRGKFAGIAIDGGQSVPVLFDKFTSNEALARNMFAKPNFVYFHFIYEAAQPAGGDSLFHAVAREHGNTGVRAVAKYLAAHPRIFFTGALQTYVGRMFLANFYRYGEMDAERKFFLGNLTKSLITESAGPANKEFLASILFMIDAFPNYTYLDSNGYADIFGTPEKMKEYIRDPVIWRLSDGRSVLGMIEGSVYIWSSMYYGERKVDGLMAQAALEILKQKPTAAFVFFDNLLRVGLMRHFFLDYGGNQLSSFGEFWAYVKTWNWSTKDFRSTVLPPSLAKGLTTTTTHDNNINAFFMLQYYLIWRLLKIIFVFLMIAVAVPLLLNGRTAPFSAFLILAFLYNIAALAIVIGEFDQPRYEDLYLFFPVMVSILGIASVPEVARRLQDSRLRQ